MIPSTAIVSDEHIKDVQEDKYGNLSTNHDYVKNGQILVTITLSEYRELLTNHATEKVNEANGRRFTVERERDELKKHVEELRKQLNDLRGMIASAVPLKVEADSQDE